MSIKFLADNDWYIENIIKPIIDAFIDNLDELGYEIVKRDDDDDGDDEVIELTTEEFDKFFDYVVDKACSGDREARKILEDFLENETVLPFNPYE